MVIILPQKKKKKKKWSEKKCVGVPPPAECRCTMLSETFCQDCGSVSITFLVCCGMVMVVVLLGVRGEVTTCCSIGWG